MSNRRRITIFAKGNVDVRDSLHLCRIGEEIKWNGINEVFRKRGLSLHARVRHETFARSDILLQSHELPQKLAEMNLDLGFHSLAAQFNTNIFSAEADVFVLSIQPDIMHAAFEHRSEKYRIVFNLMSCSEQDKQKLRSEFSFLGLISIKDSMTNLSQIIERIRERTDTPILVYNMPFAIVGERIRCFLGLDEAIGAERIRSFNLALVEISREQGIYIVDADQIMSEHGTANLRLDIAHYHPAAYRLFSEEVANILEELGFADEQ